MRRLGVWIAAVAPLVATLAAAQAPNTVNETVELVRTGIGGQQSDSQIAKTLHKWKLSEALDDRTIEELQSEGAGPKTVVELERLRDASEGLPKAAGPFLFESPAPPSAAEEHKIIAAARRIALNYTDSLPDFMANETVRRYSNERGVWQLKDTLVLRLSYFEQREDYKVLSVNGRPATLPYDALSGVTTQGEFGSLMAQVFEPRSAAEFHWEHWTRLRGRPAHVFSFVVLAAHSMYRMTLGSRGDRYGSQYTVTVGQHGLVYVDRDTGQILRITAEAESIPDRFPIRGSSTSLDYGFADVGGRQYLLPLRAAVRMVTSAIQSRNEVEFHSYKKFGAESSITFEGPVPDKPVKP